MKNYNDKAIENLERKKDKQRSKIKRKSEDRSAFQSVFDKFTYESIGILRKKGIIDEFIGILSAGKEANVYFGIDRDGNNIAIKIYKIDPHNTKWMKNYIIGDPRFKKIGSSTHKIIYTWCKKEYKNLKRMEKYKIPVPKPINLLKNVLVMEFIGDQIGTPAPKLKEIKNFEDPLKEMNFTINMIKKMFLEAKLVHGDLSEFNILYNNSEQIIIDVSQALSVQHPNAFYFLERDISNVMKFFEKFIPKDIFPSRKDILSSIIEEFNNQ